MNKPLTTSDEIHPPPSHKQARRWVGMLVLLAAVMGCIAFVYLIGQVAVP